MKMIYLHGLSSSIEKALAGLSDTPIVFSHPVYQYLQRRFSLNGRSVHWEPDEMPQDAMWTELDEILVDHPARFMIWEGQPLEESVERLEALGLGSVVLSPCGDVPLSGDYMSTMRANIAALDRVFAD